MQVKVQPPFVLSHPRYMRKNAASMCRRVSEQAGSRFFDVTVSERGNLKCATRLDEPGRRRGRRVMWVREEGRGSEINESNEVQRLRLRNSQKLNWINFPKSEGYWECVLWFETPCGSLFKKGSSAFQNIISKVFILQKCLKLPPCVFHNCSCINMAL